MIDIVGLSFFSPRSEEEILRAIYFAYLHNGKYLSKGETFVDKIQL